MNKSAIVAYIQWPKNTRPAADVFDAEHVHLGQTDNPWAINDERPTYSVQKKHGTWTFTYKNVMSSIFLKTVWWPQFQRAA